MGVKPFYGKGPHRLLCAGFRVARAKKVVYRSVWIFRQFFILQA